MSTKHYEINEVAKMLELTEGEINDLINSGRLPVAQVHGMRMLISARQLERFKKTWTLENNETLPPQEFDAMDLPESKYLEKMPGFTGGGLRLNANTALNIKRVQFVSRAVTITYFDDTMDMCSLTRSEYEAFIEWIQKVRKDSGVANIITASVEVREPNLVSVIEKLPEIKPKKKRGRKPRKEKKDEK